MSYGVPINVQMMNPPPPMPVRVECTTVSFSAISIPPGTNVQFAGSPAHLKSGRKRMYLQCKIHLELVTKVKEIYNYQRKYVVKFFQRKK